MDLPRLVWLLARQQLAFVRIGRFADPFEGTVPEDYQAGVEAEQHTNLRELLRDQMFVSCWHWNYHESEAMWRLYCGPGNGVALRTTYEKLDVSLPLIREMHLGLVEYIDQHEWPPSATHYAYAPTIRKRRSFAHEQEVRAVYWNPFPRMTRVVEQSGVRSRWEDPPLDVIAFHWDAAAVVEAIFVSPYAEDWYRAAVEAVLDRFCPALRDRLQPSTMKGTPRY